MYCEKCGSEIPRGAKFCEKCGFQVELVEEENPHKKWILGGIIGGVAFVSIVTVGVLYATGNLGGKEEIAQTSTGGGTQSDAGISDAATQTTEQPTAVPTVAPVPTPEPTEIPVESDESMGEEASGDFGNEGYLADARTPEETYIQYIEKFVEAVNTGNTDGLSQVLSGKVYKQQCDLVENYYNRGIQEELQSYSISSTKQVNDSCTRVTAKEIIKVLYEDGSSKVVKQKYSYVCKYINSEWVITGMKEAK